MTDHEWDGRLALDRHSVLFLAHPPFDVPRLDSDKNILFKNSFSWIWLDPFMIESHELEKVRFVGNRYIIDSTPARHGKTALFLNFRI
jgi:hypothetical protein